MGRALSSLRETNLKTTVLFSAIAVLPLFYGASNCGGPSKVPESRSYGSSVDKFISANYIPSWSPDGSLVAFTIVNLKHADGSYDAGAATYVVRTDGSELWRVTETTEWYEEDYTPSFSPDGTRLLYTTSRHPPAKQPDARRSFEIETSALDGSDRRRLTNHRDDDTSPAWSPDGRHIAFSRGSGDSSGIYVMAADGSDRRQLVGYSSLNPVNGITRPQEGPVWSPNGRTLAFVVLEILGSSSNQALYTVNADGSGLKSLFYPHPYGVVITSAPAWSPDGERLAFLLGAPEADPLYPSGVYMVDPNRPGLSEEEKSSDAPRGMAELLSPIPMGQFRLFPVGLAWAPDGSRILVHLGKQTDRGIDINYELQRSYVIDVNGNVVKFDAGRYSSWSPDGTRIASLSHSTVVSPKLDEEAVHQPILLTMAPDGSDVRVLVRIAREGGLELANESR